MKSTLELTAEQEIQAHQLAAQISEALAGDILAMARLLVSQDTAHTFGQTELQLRDLTHRAGAKVLQLGLLQKKTAMKDRV